LGKIEWERLKSYSTPEFYEFEEKIESQINQEFKDRYNRKIEKKKKNLKNKNA